MLKLKREKMRLNNLITWGASPRKVLNQSRRVDELIIKHYRKKARK